MLSMQRPAQRTLNPLVAHSQLVRYCGRYSVQKTPCFRDTQNKEELLRVGDIIDVRDIWQELIERHWRADQQKALLECHALKGDAQLFPYDALRSIRTQ